MQKYSKEPYKYQPNLDEKMNGDGNTFSTKGCLMTAVAKIASEVSGKEIDPYLDVNQKLIRIRMENFLLMKSLMV